MTEKAHSERGFRIFGQWEGRRGRVLVIESSLAFEGAHVRIYHGDDNLNEHVHVDVADAKQIITALATFIAEAEADELTEPVER